MPCDNRDRDWNDATANQDMPRIAGHQRKLDKGEEVFSRTYRDSVVLPDLGLGHLASRTVRE